jgi:hypothetical protein
MPLDLPVCLDVVVYKSSVVALRRRQLLHLAMHPALPDSPPPHTTVQSNLCLHVYRVLQVAQNHMKQDQLFHLVMHLPTTNLH